VVQLKKLSKKKLNQNGQFQNDLSKMAFLSSWTWGQNEHIFLIEIPSQNGHDFL
jgi:hypothetical protein